tara:strand:- start:270 stop:548 length:279 start_codon:yes stop_codon:yes gene_type:complete
MKNMDVYRIVENLLEYKIPLKHRYILTEMNESKCVQIRTTNWDTHSMIQTTLNHSPLLAGTYNEGWCEGLKEHGLEHGDIQVIEVKQITERK